MIRVSVFYRRKPGASFDFDRYVNGHMPIAKERLRRYGLVKLEIDKGIAGEPYPCFAVTHWIFPTLRVYQTGLSTEMEELIADIPQFSNMDPEVVVSEIQSVEVFDGQATEGQTPTSAVRGESKSMDEFDRVGSVEGIPPGTMALVEYRGQPIALANVDGSFYAVSAICKHRAGPLTDGRLRGTSLVCPWHGATYDVQTGAVTRPPAQEGLETYLVKVEDGEVFLGVDKVKESQR